MDKIDARELTYEALELLRKQAIRLFKKGKSISEVAELLGIHRNTVGRWHKEYYINKKGFKVKKRGRKKGSQNILTPEQEKEIQRIIIDKMPDQLKLSFALWTRRAIQLLIYQTYKIDIPIRTIGNYLKRWGFTPQKPLRKAYEQRPAEVKKWLDEVYPEIAERAKEEKAEIHWGDETGMRNDSQAGKSFSPKGETPVIRISSKRESLNMISTVTNQGTVRFMIYEETMTSQVLIKFLERLIKDNDKKVFLILDNLKVHHSVLVKEWVENHKNQIEIFYLPSYSPELNPDEYLNCDLKNGVHTLPPSRSKKGLKKNVFSHMKKLQKSPARVRKYFLNENISYAA